MCNSCGTPNEFPIVDPGTGSGGKPVVIIEGPSIDVEDLSDADTYRFRVSYEAYNALSASLTLVALEGGVSKSSPVLKGTVIDTVELDWTYNKSVLSQELSNTGGISNPTLGIVERSHDFTSQTIDSNITFTISGDDGNGVDPGSVAVASKSITFGNYMIIGHTTNFNLLATADLLTAISGFSKEIKTSRAHTYFATGGVNNHHYVIYPKAYGLATFTKLGFEGGYVRLKNVSGILKQELGEGDIESDVTIENDKGFSEAYYVYMSLYDNQADAVNPFTLT